MLQVVRVEAAEGEAFLPRLLALHPGVGNALQLRQGRGSGFVDLQAEPAALAMAQGVAEVLHGLVPGIEVETGQVYPRFFAELQGCQADIHVIRQVLRTDLVEHRPGVVMVAEVAETPDQLGAAVGRADGVE
ncbi:hypothetical protein D9M71_103990 [compost metagenome]